jgi:integrase
VLTAHEAAAILRVGRNQLYQAVARSVVRTSLRARTVARYAALLRDHVRPEIGARPLKQLTPLEVQAIYDRLAVGGRRDGKPGGLEWSDLDLDAGTVRFRRALTNIDPAVLPGDADPGGRRKELAVGPVKSAASSTILTLPPFALRAPRRHRRQQLRPGLPQRRLSLALLGMDLL